MKLGTSITCITPEFPLRLSGFESRTGVFEAVKEDIYVRVQLHSEKDSSILFIYGDLLWWSSDFVAKARNAIWACYGIPEEALFFVASHNHSAPPTGNLFTPTLETYSAQYAEFLLEKVLSAVKAAVENQEEVTATRHDGSADLSVFRRVIRDGVVLMRPNYDVAVDSHLTVISYRRANGSLKGCLIHYPCHANLSKDNVVQPEYPGMALRMLDAENAGSVSLFFQGCTADIRPKSILGAVFTSVDYDGVVRFAAQFYEAICRTLKQAGTAVTPTLKQRRARINLPLEGLNTHEEITALLQAPETVQREWAQKVLEKNNRDYETLELSYINYGDCLKLFLLNAETSQYYAMYAKTLAPDSLCVSYANGMIGYLCTAQQIEEGGYEPEGSALYFALSGTYTTEIEAIIHREMQKLL